MSSGKLSAAPISSGKLSAAPMISAAAALPSTPANEWASRTNDMLAGAQGLTSPVPHVPGAFPEDTAESPTTDMGEALIAHAKAVVGYFGVATNGDAAQKQGQSLENSNLSTSSSTTSSLSAANIQLHEADSDSPREAGYTRLSSTAASVTSLAVLTGSTQSLGVFTTGSIPTASSSCAALENVPLSPNVPPIAHPTPVLHSSSTTGNRNAQTYPYIHASRIPVAGEPESLSAPLVSNLKNENSNSSAAPFTPIPPVNPSLQYFSMSVPVQSPTNEDTIDAHEHKTRRTHALLTHAGTHANGHTDAEEAQRAAFTRGGSPQTANGHFEGKGTAESVAPTHNAEAATAAAGHVFTTGGVYVAATLGAAQVAHAGAFIVEGDRRKESQGDGNEDDGEGEGKKEGKASRFVAKLKGKMHVG